MNHWVKLGRKLVDLFLPRSRELQEIEEMSLIDFWRRAKRSEKRFEKNILTIFSYKDPLVKTAIWQIKYRNNQKILKLLAEILYSELLEELVDLLKFYDFTRPILMPIPMVEARRKVRGYNQTENLAREMMRIDKNRSLELMTDILIKTKDTEPQSSLPRTLRLQNLKGCFAVQDISKIHGRNIILIDDVMTTGATIGECEETLMRSGARKVIGVVIAH